MTTNTPVAETRPDAATSTPADRPVRRAGHSHAVSLGLLVLRVVVGITFLMHGWQKVSEWGFSGTAQSFEGMGVPAPAASAAFAIVVELVGGIALIFGVFTRIAGALLALDMVGALVLVHMTSGFFAAEGGVELVLILAAAALALAFTGPGRYAVASAVPSRGSAGILA